MVSAPSSGWTKPGVDCVLFFLGSYCQLRPALEGPSLAQKAALFSWFLLVAAPSLGGSKPGAVHCSQG
ncbi:hypothetical protein A2U01_0111551 [Trifolium medium]|uniref:Uncharacterized protein n=1 Tax=Trifolium medium TaxID=97028 RepID=A0A392VS46_9FABA|nr:hypothetical protein [Trifolium medium]